ncbi:MAG: YifB family Mg chelatase-like AAA ATPase [Candidatus Pacebacteria bacterium]|nr:YifB family Mg chelatase-like AAA ATPase [Candidatus Paceibacterota bacterium]
MVSRVYSAVLRGLSGQLIEIEVAANRGLRSFGIVGLADKAIEEAKERVNSAIKSINLAPPHSQTQRIIVNLAPADLKKEGSLYDLPIALGYLLATQQTKFQPEKRLLIGELALDGRLKAVPGALALALLAKEQGFSEIILPKDNSKEACLANLLDNQNTLKIIGAGHIKEVLDYIEGRVQIESAVLDKDSLVNNIQDWDIDFAFISGQTHTKRGLEIAAAGGHNIFLEGPPGTGKTLLAKAVVSILPNLEPQEMLELTKIYSLVGLLKSDKPFVNQRPFRAPHHTASESALVGGGSPIKPGEITLAHRGVLFLDEFPEFHRDVLESLRQPLEQGEISILRARHNISYPANFILIASANPCPCGFHNHPEKECSCTGSQVASYRRKLSGPLMDRMDIFCWVNSVKYEELKNNEGQATSGQIKEKIQRARNLQGQRFQETKILTNAEMNIPQIKQYCQLEPKTENLLKKYVESGHLSARGYHRVLKVARTIADLEKNDRITFDNLNEALMYRKRDSN